MSQFIRLPNGVILDASLIQCVVRQEVNVYAIVMKECPVTLKADLADVEALEQALGVSRYEAPKPALVAA